ncbi:toxin-antitoxin system HicB family antitoxin [Leptolyngbya sp. FACHB-711]|uniref:toxin-antitoxin system HicB family antitoxin n=1 Tax=unclassified Leptolyngbya TaxID=2650499 RepID=UPI001686DF10|nr:toxin-antitoxin system HicB family antitoxin [Leptolyngbya sp. FACHB-711]MBD1851010.1 toxin-antitoxin system HicB family antitoxin [Cyanobacteria bacterium FACHB-502]MBD2027205.1 toxin-antitoxin system HicB family antitoxin [Leptolyngbya sp. FACHB-711]
MAASKRKPEIRVFVERDLDRLLKVLAGIKDTSLSGLVNEAIEFYLNHNTEVQNLIDRFNLEDLSNLED